MKKNSILKGKKSLFEKKNLNKNVEICYPLLLSGQPWVSLKNVSPFGPAVWPARSLLVPTDLVVS